MKLPAVKKNLLDRAIEVVSPRLASERLRHRMLLAAVGGYEGAGGSSGSLFNWSPAGVSADAASIASLPSLRARSRDLIRNAPIATGAINTVATSVVGQGLKPKPEIDASALGFTDDRAAEWEASALREFNLWAKSQEADVTRTQNFYGLQDLVLRSCMESGDVFAVKRFLPRPGSPYALKIQVVEADRVSNPNRKPDRPWLIQGVEIDDNGAPLSYFISDKHPGTYLARGGLKWERILAFGVNSGMRQVMHLYDRLRPGQTRGVPYLAPVITKLRELARYSDAEITAAVVNACFAITLKTDNVEGMNLTDTNSKDGKDESINLTEPGQLVELGLNESLENFESKRPNTAFDPFVQAILRQVGVALELPFELLIKHFTASYSASRAALLEANKFFKKRRAFLSGGFCTPFYEALITEAVAVGRLDAPGFFTDPLVHAAYLGVTWVGPAPGQIQPLPETRSIKARIDMGLTSLDQETSEYNGGNWEANHRQRAREVAARRTAGLEIDPAALAPASTAGGGK